MDVPRSHSVIRVPGEWKQKRCIIGKIVNEMRLFSQTQDRYTMWMASMNPAWWRNSNEMVTEVDKYINQIPLCKTVSFRIWAS